MSEIKNCKIIMTQTREVPAHGLLEKDNEYTVSKPLGDQLIQQGFAVEAMKPKKSTKTAAPTQTNESEK